MCGMATSGDGGNGQVLRESHNLDHLAEVAVNNLQQGEFAWTEVLLREIQRMITFCRESMNVRFP